MLIRDPIHGDVDLSRAETRVLDTPELQRLRGIRQLGTAELVYPGCVHTRFNHSLGVNALAKRIVQQLRHTGAAIDADLETAIGVAALLHDVTHVPFGHTLEDERRLFPRHDKGDRLAILLAGPLGEVLAELGMRQLVTALLLPGGVDTAPAWARQIVASTIDADLLDYLRRDAYFAGLAQSYDDRIFRHFVIADGQLAIDMTKHGMERLDARSETAQLLRLRYFLTERVYYHHTKVIAGAMISKAVELAHRAELLHERELLAMTDATLFERLHYWGERDPRLTILLDRLQQRQLLKRGYVLSARSVPPAARSEMVARYHDVPSNRAQAESYLAELLGCDEAEVIVYCPALTVMKEAAALVSLPQGLTPLNAPDLDGGLEIQALEARYASLWRFYVFVPEELAARAAARAEEIFGYATEHRPR